MTTSNPGIARPVEYLFVDGAYLRRHLEEWSKDFFSGARIELDFAQFARGFQKANSGDAIVNPAGGGRVGAVVSSRLFVVRWKPSCSSVLRSEETWIPAFAGMT